MHGPQRIVPLAVVIDRALASTRSRRQLEQARSLQAEVDELLTWGYDNNYTGWATRLGNELGSDTVSPVAAPARLADFSGLAPAYIDVGDLDIFRDESIAYAGGLARAGVPVELHVHPGCPHGFEGKPLLEPAPLLRQRRRRSDQLPPVTER